jgi:DNA-binding response OmpR family regulator
MLALANAVLAQPMVPVLRAVSEPSSAPDRVAVEARAVRVLVVDDEPLIGLVVRRTLSDCQVDYADSVEAAMELAADRTYDLVLCDLMMPLATGMDLHAAWQVERPELAERMVFMTGGAFSDVSRRFLATMGSRTIAKPFHPEQLRRRARLAAR